MKKSSKISKVIKILNTFFAILLLGIIALSAFVNEPRIAMKEKYNQYETVAIASHITPPVTTAEKKDVEGPIMAILMLDLGLNSTNTDYVYNMVPEIGMGFSVYAYNLDKQTSSAKERGHEVYINLPMQPVNYPISNPGPLALLLENTAERNLIIFNAILDRADNQLDGLYVTGPESFTSDMALYRPILEQIKQRNLSLIYTFEPNAVNNREAEQILGKKILSSPIWLDTQLEQSAILNKLADLEAEAEKHGMVLGVANAYPIVINVLNTWISNGNHQTKLVPVSMLLTKYRILDITE